MLAIRSQKFGVQGRGGTMKAIPLSLAEANQYIASGFIKRPEPYHYATLSNEYKDRLAPWFTLVNAYKFNRLGLKYYDENRMLFVNNNTTHDTGAVFLEDCQCMGESIYELPDDTEYYIHYKGGSYMNKDNVMLWLHSNEHYWKDN